MIRTESAVERLIAAAMTEHGLDRAAAVKRLEATKSDELLAAFQADKDAHVERLRRMRTA